MAMSIWAKILLNDSMQILRTMIFKSQNFAVIILFDYLSWI